jgi:hypothetical protein
MFQKFKNHSLTYFALFVIGLSSNCTGDSEVLATYEGGVVTRKELRDFYALRNIEVSEKTASLQSQSQILEQMAVQKIVYKEFFEAEKILPEFLDKITGMTQGQMLLSLHKKNFEDRLKKRVPIQFAEVQTALFQKSEEGAEAKADELLAKLNGTSSKKEINRLIQENTMHKPTKAVSGMVGPTCLNCGEDDMTILLEKCLEADDGKFQKVSLDDGIYLIRIVEKRSIHLPALTRYLTKSFSNLQSMAKEFRDSVESEEEKNLAEGFTNGEAEEIAKQYENLFSNRFKTFQWAEEMKRIRNVSGITTPNAPILVSPESLDLKTLNETFVLAKYSSGKELTLGEFQKDFKDLSKVVKKPVATNERQDLWDLLNFFYNNYIVFMYFEEAPEAEQIRKTDLFEESLKSLKYSFAWTLFMQEILAENVEVTENEIRDTYEAGKKYGYSTPDPANSQNRIPKPYSSVRAEIKESLENAKRKSIFDQRLAQLKTEYALKLASESLTEGKI